MCGGLDPEQTSHTFAFTYRNDVHLQTISNKKQSYHACCVDVQLLASYQESLALLGLWLGVFLTQF